MSSSGTLVLAPAVTVGGRPLDGALLSDLVEVRVELERNATAECLLRFVDVGFTHVAEFSLGDEVSVTAPGGSGGPLFTGELTAFDVDARDGEPPELTVIAHDRSHRLAYATTTHSYVDGTYQDAISDLASDSGLSADVDAAFATDAITYYLRAEDGRAWLDEVCTTRGATWWVDDKTLHVSDDPDRGSVRRTFEEDLRSIHAHVSSGAPDTIKVVDWQPGADPIEAERSAPDDAPSDLVERAADGTSAWGQRERVVAYRGTEDESEAGHLATALAGRLRANATTVRGACTPDNGLVPGATVEVAGAGPLDGCYPLTRTVHLYRASTGFTCRFDAGSFDRRGLGALVAQPRERTTGGGLGRHDELLFAKVTNIKDPDDQGRVRVKFPGLTDQDESAWARVAALGAGADRGAIFLPEVDDDVIVGFERGDVRRPVVLGGIYSGDAAQPPFEADDGGVTTRRIQSRLKHYLEFGDGQGSDQQYIALSLDGESQRLFVGKEEIVLEGDGSKPLRIENGQASMVLDQGKVTIKGTDIVLEATNQFSAKGATVSVEGSGQVAVKSNGTLDLKASATAAVEGSAMLTLKGGMVQIN